MSQSQNISEQTGARTGTPRSLIVWICIVLSVSVAAVYWPVTSHEFIHCDDPDYVTNNPDVQSGLTWHGLAWAFTTDHGNNWHPLTWISHMLDCQLFGLRPGWHHATNALFHIANTVLLFLALRKMTGAVWRSAFVAALFGLHPLHVESVAWVAERKDVLSTFFFMLTLIAYAKYVSSVECRVSSGKTGSDLNPPSPSRFPPVSRYYVLSLVLFSLSLMSKPMLVTLPFLLLLLDYWPLNRLQVWEPNVQGPKFKVQRSKFVALLVEKLPFLALAVPLSVVTVLVQQHEGNMASLAILPLEVRIENTIISYAAYLQKAAWPLGLAPYYPYVKELSEGRVAAAAFALLLISIATLSYWRKKPYLLVGWLWYLGTLVPVIGLVQVGFQAMADRYTYIPLVGPFIAATWLATDFLERWRFGRPALGLASLAMLGALTTDTWFQIKLWKDTETLYRHTLAVTSENAQAHINLGTVLAERGKIEAAEREFAEAVRIRPAYAEARSNLGVTLAAQGKLDEAIELYRSALAIRPRVEQTHFLLGSALSMKGQRDEAISEYRTALQINPNHLLALNDLSWMLATDPRVVTRNGAEAVQLAERLCRLTKYQYAQFVGTLGAAYAEANRFDDAVSAGEKAEKIANAAGQAELAKRNRELVGLYREHKPYHENAIELPTPNR